MSDLINDNTMHELSIETFFTFLIALFMIFIGINENVDKKEYQKKNLLVMYFILFFILVFFDNVFIGFSIFLFLWYISGVTYLQSEELSLEKHLSNIQLFHYGALYWIFNVKSYILIYCFIFIVITNRILNFALNIYFTGGIILLFFFMHYVKNTRDNFAIRNWEDVRNDIFQVSTQNDIKDEVVNLSFLYFMEDKNLFKRRSLAFGFYDLLAGMKKYKNMFNLYLKSNRSNGKHNNSKLKRLLRLKKFFRGYSTIDQQVTRRCFMTSYSYIYTYRRKLFVERVLNKNFGNAWCKLKSREYKKNDIKNAKRRLKTSLKYHYLRYYYIDTSVA